MLRAYRVLIVLAALAGCGESDGGSDGVVRREGQPDFVRSFDEKKMDRAIAEARSTLGEFIQALADKKPGTSGFSVKKGFPNSKGAMEFIWISGVRRAGDDFEGEIDNEPVDLRNLKVGQVVRVAKAEAVDWLFKDQGRLRGGYTIVALVHGTPDQAKYEKEMGIDWSRYRFLKP